MKRARQDDKDDVLPLAKRAKCEPKSSVPFIDDILFVTFKFLPGRDLNTIRLVCKSWYAVQNQPLFIQTICKERQVLHDTYLILEKKKVHTKYYMFLGAKQGQATSFDPITQALVSSWTMKDDKKHGFCTMFNKNGTPRQVNEYKHGKKNGNRKVYQNGILVKDADYQDDKLHGKCKVWNKHGALLFDGGFFQGKKHGLVQVFEPKGETSALESRYHFDKGVLHGNWQLFHTSGWKKEERNYDHGKLHGVAIQFYKTGEEWIRQTYEQGVLVHTEQK